ncbi:iron chelate uptake ABC transporter family permease subunit [Paractinoplanes durhamensis]
MLTALLVGAALAVSGALTQTFARNPWPAPMYSA